MLEEVDDFLFREWVKAFKDTEKSGLPSLLYSTHRGVYINIPLMIWKISEGI
ncbi:MAG: hypothetical protein HXS54_09705 [Theionarchaea archaeon]|nr:hypothetical protein [Theionarchaea archaeon]